MLHEMRLKPDPFEGIEAGKKKIEFRLCDEKRRLIKPGDKILFTNTDTGQNILTYVVDIHKADSFVQLKEVLVKKNLIEENDFEPSTMLKYYSSEEEKEYGVVGVEIALLSD
ncbi:ASCH domain protein [Clostridium sp. L2-50]|nr:ASCH domain protein [Clostridium sp. L2-50]UEA75078.1 RNA-binding protein [Lachnospiraceae bacterium GAM79]UEA78269.1 RNA-binding protein [Lachnospiraceae bacterium GAM79]